MTCPYCKKYNPCHSHVDGTAKPSDGDISMCIDCGEPAVFQFEYTSLRKINEQEIIELKKDGTWNKIRKLASLIQERKVKQN